MAGQLRISRRGFLYVAAALTAAMLGRIYAPKAMDWLSERTPDPSATPTATSTPSPTKRPYPSKTPAPLGIDEERVETFVQHATQTATPAPGWRIPTNEEWKEMVSAPEFWTEPIGPSGRRLLTPQFDMREYERLLDRSKFDTCNYRGNSCGPAVIATLTKAYGYRRTGDVPDVTIADVINTLLPVDHEGYDLIRLNGTNMTDHGLMWGIDYYGALDFYGERSGLYRAGKFLSKDWGTDDTQLVPTSDWAGIFAAGRRDYLEKDGMLVSRALKYKGAHFFLMPYLNNGGEPMIVDSVGTYRRGHPEMGGHIGEARIIGLGAWVDNWGDIPGLLFVGGVLPTD